MNSQKIYDRLIDRARTRQLDTYVEKHHIIPRCLGGSDDLTNIVELTSEEHFLAHQLLLKLNPNNYKLAHAAHMMGNTRITNKSYAWLRKQHAKATSDQMRALWQDDVYRTKILSALRSANNDPINKAKRSAALKERWSDPLNRSLLLNRPSQVGRVFSEEHKQRISASRIGIEPSNKGQKTGKPAHNKGTVASEETRQKMRESAKRRWDTNRASE